MLWEQPRDHRRFDDADRDPWTCGCSDGTHGLRAVRGGGRDTPADERQPWRAPRPVAELSSTVAYAVRNKIAVVPQSGNTGLVRGSTPDASGYELVLSLDRLRGELAIDPLDRTIRASAGMRLSELNTALEPAGLWLPVDLGSDPMLGGMVATNTGGARFIRYGGIRQRVLALTVVLADENGTVLQLGSGLRKDNSRLDLRHLFVGSSGAFGVIAEATLEVARRPAQAHSALLVPASPRCQRQAAEMGRNAFRRFPQRVRRHVQSGDDGRAFPMFLVCAIRSPAASFRTMRSCWNLLPPCRTTGWRSIHSWKMSSLHCSMVPTRR